MEVTPKMRNMFIVLFLILVFLFFIANAWFYRNNPVESFKSEYFNCNKLQKIIDNGQFKGNQVNLIPCTPQLINNDKWFNRYDPNDANNLERYQQHMVTAFQMRSRNDDGVDVITHVNGAFTLNQDQIKSINGTPLDTNRMTLSFWLYIDKSTGPWKPIFQMGNREESGSYYSPRSPGVWLRWGDRPSLHVRRVVSNNRIQKEQNNGADFFTETINSIPIQKPAYVSIVFHEKVYKMYINGTHVQTWEGDRPQKDPRVIDNEDRTNVKRIDRFIWIGPPAGEGYSHYYLRKMELFPTPLTEHEVQLLYCQNKQSAENDKTFAFQESFQNRVSKPISVQESFVPFKFNSSRFHALALQSGTNTSSRLPGNEFDITSSSVEFLSDADTSKEEPIEDIEMSSNATIEQEAKDLEEAQDDSILPSGLKIKKVRLNKIDFPNLNSDKKLPFFRLKSKKKQYLKWNKDFDLQGTSGVTFMFWYRPSFAKSIEYSNGYNSSEGWNQYYSKNKSWARFFDFGNGPGEQNILSALKWKTNTFHVYNSPTDKQYDIQISGRVGTGNHWYHFAVVLTREGGSDSTKGTWKYFHNGNVLNEVGGGERNYPIDGLRANQYIGKSNWSNDPYYDGDIGDFRIYKKALSEDEVIMAMNDIPNASESQFTGF